MVGAFDDPDALGRLAAGAAVVTYEFENVPVEAARAVAPLPPPRALELGQDRLVEKQLFRASRHPDGALRLGRRHRAARAREVAPPRVRRQGPAARRRSRSGSATTSSRRRSSTSTASCRSSPCAGGTARRGSGRSPRTCTATGSCASPARRRPLRRQAEAEELAGRLLDELELRRRARARAVRGRRSAARERVRAARPQHRPLDDRRRRHEPVREPPARRSSACRSGDTAALAPVGHGQPDRRRSRRSSALLGLPARTCTCTGRSRGAAASSGT